MLSVNGGKDFWIEWKWWRQPKQGPESGLDFPTKPPTQNPVAANKRSPLLICHTNTSSPPRHCSPAWQLMWIFDDDAHHLCQQWMDPRTTDPVDLQAHTHAHIGLFRQLKHRCIARLGTHPSCSDRRCYNNCSQQQPLERMFKSLCQQYASEGKVLIPMVQPGTSLVRRLWGLILSTSSPSSGHGRRRYRRSWLYSYTKREDFFSRLVSILAGMLFYFTVH